MIRLLGEALVPDSVRDSLINIETYFLSGQLSSVRAMLLWFMTDKARLPCSKLENTLTHSCQLITEPEMWYSRTSSEARTAFLSPRPFVER